MSAITRKVYEITKEQKRSERLLGKLLPKNVALGLKNNERISESFDAATIMFSTIKDFRNLAKERTPLEVITLLNSFYKYFDSHIGKWDVYKVETINDQYMVASGVPYRNGDKHVEEIAQLSLMFIQSTKKMRFPKGARASLQISVGFHSGHVVAGVIGTKMPRYCIFGDTVNTAARMESTSEAMKIQISVDTKMLLETRNSAYVTTPRGPNLCEGNCRFWFDCV